MLNMESNSIGVLDELINKIITQKNNIEDTNLFTGEDSEINDNCNGCSYFQYQFKQI